MIAMACLFLHMLCDCFKSRRRLEAEILVLRHQLNVLQQRAPRRLHLRWADRALFVWLYRGCPRILDAITIRWMAAGSAPWRPGPDGSEGLPDPLGAGFLGTALAPFFVVVAWPVVVVAWPVVVPRVASSLWH